MRRSSGQIVLICEECGERLVLIGADEVWRSEQTAFECECGEKAALTNRIDVEDSGSLPQAI